MLVDTMDDRNVGSSVVWLMVLIAILITTIGYFFGFYILLVA